MTSAVKEEAERLQDLAARILAAESSEESEEEIETSALDTVMERLTSLRQKIDAILNSSKQEKENPEDGLTNLRTKFRSWHSRQLEMRSIDVFLKQSKLERNEEALQRQVR